MFGVGSRSLVVAVAIRALLVAGTLAGAFNFACGKTVNALYRTPRDMIATCSVTREECVAGFAFANGGFGCTSVVAQPTFTTTACFISSSEPPAAGRACGRYCNEANNPNDPHNPQILDNRWWDMTVEACHVELVSARPANPGECEKITNVASNGATAFATCTRGGRQCTMTAKSGSKTICANRAPLTNEARSDCFDPTKTSADDFCSDNFMIEGDGMLQEPRLNVIDVALNDNLRCPVAAASPLTAYGLGVGAVGSAVHGTDTFALNATGGSVTFVGTCDSSGEFCNFSQLKDLKVTLSDVVVSGTTVQNLEGRLTKPAPIVVTGGVRKIAKANFRFDISGTFLGQTARFSVHPASDVVVNANSQTASFSFSSTFGGTTPGLDGVPITVTANVSASTSNPGAGCGSLSSIQRILGFEDLDWTSPQVILSQSPALHTQGCYGLNLAGGGYIVANSTPFATPLAGVTSTLKLDVYVPPGQPNPYWFGAVQLFASCPSGAMNNAYLGQVELTGKPTGAFSTLSYAVPSTVQTTLLGAHNDCFFCVAVNVNQTPTPVVLDNLRFTP